MSALAIARRKLAEIAARGAQPPPAPAELNGVGATTPPAVPDPETSRVAPPTRPEPAAPPAETSRVNFVSFVESAPGPAPAELSDCLLEALKAEAATGDAHAARQAVALADYWAACDRGEVALAETPGSIAAREWNRMVDERERAKLSGKPPRRQTSFPDRPRW